MSTSDKKITIVSLGGGAGKILNHLNHSENNSWLDFLFIDTDKKMVESFKNQNVETLAIGDWEHSLGCGGNATKASQYTKDNLEDIFSAIGQTDILIIISTLGGGTGTGAAPIITKEARKRKILTFSFVTKPQDWEGKNKKKLYDKATKLLFKDSDALLEFPTSQLIKSLASPDIENCFNEINRIIADCVLGIAELSRSKGSLKIDLPHVREFLNRAEAECFIALGYAKGLQAIDAAFNDFRSFPLLEKKGEEENLLSQCDSALLSIVCGSNFTVNDIEKVRNKFSKILNADTNLEVGVSYSFEDPNQLQLTMLGLIYKEKSIAGRLENSLHNPITGKHHTIYQSQELPLQESNNHLGFFANKKPTIHQNIVLDIPTFIRQNVKIDKN